MRLLIWLSLLFPALVWGQGFEGVVVDSATGSPLAYAQVRWHPNGPGTLTNEAGGFMIMAPAGLPTDTLRVSYLGYPPRLLTTAQWPERSPLTIPLPEAGITLDSVQILPIEPEDLLRQALQAIPTNYHAQPINAELFYRELIQEDDRYVELSEAVMRAYKQPPRAQRSGGDQLQLLKGRRRTLPQKDSTLTVQLGAGLPQLLVGYPVVGAPLSHSFLQPEDMNLYEYQWAGTTQYQGREVYVIRFDQAKKLRKRLYRGEIYLDVRDLAFVQINYEPSPRGKKFRLSQLMGLGQQSKLAIAHMLGYRLDPQGDTGRILCVRQGEDWYLSYLRRNVTFLIDTPQRQGKGPATVVIASEMLFTDLAADRPGQPIPDSQRLPPDTPMKEAVGHYDASFWENYQTIQLRPELAELFE
jgi:hypothetical protein